MDYAYFQIFFASAIIVPMIYHWEKVVNIVGEYMLFKPGVGKVSVVKKGKKRCAIAHTCLGNFKIPFYKTPCLEMDVSFFLNSDIEDKNVMISRHDFREKYGNLDYATLRRFDTGIITDIAECEDFFNKKEIFGFIDSLFEDQVYVFHIEGGRIDYKKLFNDYENSLEID